MTITPEIIAFVVAMAGIILPAMAIKIRKEKKSIVVHITTSRKNNNKK